MLQESFLVLILSANVLYELCGMFVLTIKYGKRYLLPTGAGK